VRNGGESIDLARLREVTDALDLHERPEILPLIRDLTGVESYSRVLLTTRGIQRREETFPGTAPAWPTDSASGTIILNGEHGLVGGGSNHQADIHRLDNFPYGVRQIGNFCHWPLAQQLQANSKLKWSLDEGWTDLVLKAAVPNATLEYRIDRESGFIYSRRSGSKESERVHFFLPQRNGQGARDGASEYRMASHSRCGVVIRGNVDR
jgi:hypothetical protein